uniref:Uncharacterized protein n=1 Tax=Paracidobacterium acidisoli TaxID=2303751 RepID=A0A372IR26_9BACT
MSMGFHGGAEMGYSFPTLAANGGRRRWGTRILWREKMQIPPLRFTAFRFGRDDKGIFFVLMFGRT